MFHENERETSYETTEIGSHAFCGSGLARDAGAAVYLDNCVDPIASKPAPTKAKKG
jgi:hypothetical protein